MQFLKRVESSQMSITDRIGEMGSRLRDFISGRTIYNSPTDINVYFRPRQDGPGLEMHLQGDPIFESCALDDPAGVITIPGIARTPDGNLDRSKITFLFPKDGPKRVVALIAPDDENTDNS